MQPRERDARPAPSGRSTSTLLLALSVLLAAANLRPSITAVGPVLHLVADDTGLRPSQLGLLGAIPLLTFAVVSPLVHSVSRRYGIEHTVFASLLVLAAGTVVRSIPGFLPGLWIGTIVLGAAIAIVNVLLPTLVKRDFPTRVPLMTGAYSSLLSGFAALASGFSLPMSAVLGWPAAIGAWAVLALLGAALWLPGSAATASRTPSPTGPSTRPPRLDVAVAAGVAGRAVHGSAVDRLLPPHHLAADDRGPARRRPLAAGWHLFLYQAMSVVAGLGVTAFLQGRRDQRLVGVVVGLLSLSSMVGLILVPQLVLAWVVLIGLTSGSSLVIALTLVAQRSRTSADATRLSGMIQGIGYALAAVGPAGAGLLFDLTSSWTPALLIVGGAGVLQAVSALSAGRDRYTHAAGA
ncbi:MFS transporter [Naasia aerilata]|uniref:MFS transporter n=1 Tax=Naasia aerilata TaxID=1162966 RepID=A0ABM8GB11_9MICO|nr:MFS transporter [Naasia aerilata]